MGGSTLHILDRLPPRAQYTPLCSSHSISKYSIGTCFEPAQDNFRLLVQNLSINSLANILAANIACSDVAGRAPWVLAGQFSGLNRIGAETATPLVSTIATTTIDKETAETTGEIGLIKVDTEGHELAVLIGARGTLERSPRALAIVENNNQEALVAFFLSIGWRPFLLDKAGDIGEPGKPTTLVQNLLACGPRHPLFEQVGRVPSWIHERKS